MHYAIKYSHQHIIDFLLSVEGYLADEYDSLSALIHLASSVGNIKLVKQLFSLGHGFDSTNHNDWDFLHYASANGHDSIITSYLATFKTERFLLCDRNGKTLYHHATINNHENVVKVLFEAKVPEISKSDNVILYFIMVFLFIIPKNPMHYAAQFGHIGVLKYLVSIINVNIHDLNGVFFEFS